MTSANHSSRCELRLDLGALARNYRALAERAGGRLGVVVKADAYGLGVERLVPVLRAAGATDFFVASAEEACAIVGMIGEQALTYVFDGADEDSLPLLLDSGAIPVLNSAEQVECWRASGRGRSAALHVDTGMARLGVPHDALADLDLSGVNLSLLMTHLACADEPDHPMNARQLARFNAVRGLFPGVPTSLANSPGLFLDAAFRSDLPRAGIVLYGGLANTRNGSLEAVASLSAKVLSVRDLDAGESVGYGATWVAERPVRLATVALGYADGLPRALSNQGWLTWQGQRLPIRGRVSMDLTTVEITDADPAPGVGDWLEVFGPSASITELATAADTIDYTLLTGLGRRHRVIET